MQQLSASIAMKQVRELLKSGHTVTIPVQGKSMWPFLSGSGNMVIISSPENFTLHDVVLFEFASGVFVLHRVVGIEGNTVLLCGDGNTTIESCRQEDIVGKATAFIMSGKKPVFLATSRKWKLYSFFWTKMYCVRKPIIMLYRAYCKILGR